MSDFFPRDSTIIFLESAVGSTSRRNDDGTAARIAVLGRIDDTRRAGARQLLWRVSLYIYVCVCMCVYVCVCVCVWKCVCVLLRVPASASSQPTNDRPTHSLSSKLPAEIKSSFETPVLLSALGGLVSYLRSLLLDRDLLPGGTYTRYCPLREGDSLLLDGQVRKCISFDTRTHTQTHTYTAHACVSSRTRVRSRCRRC
jgi:hypothetical protein